VDVEYLDQAGLLRFRCGGLQGRVQMRRIGVDGDHGQACALPKVLMLDLGDGDVEALAQARLDAAQRVTLVP